MPPPRKCGTFLGRAATIHNDDEKALELCRLIECFNINPSDREWFYTVIKRSMLDPIPVAWIT